MSHSPYPKSLKFTTSDNNNEYEIINNDNIFNLNIINTDGSDRTLFKNVSKEVLLKIIDDYLLNQDDEDDIVTKKNIKNFLEFTKGGKSHRKRK